MSESSPLLENIHLRHNMHIAELRFYLRQHPGRSDHLLEKAVSVPLPRFVDQSPTFRGRQTPVPMPDQKDISRSPSPMVRNHWRASAALGDDCGGMRTRRYPRGALGHGKNPCRYSIEQ